MLTDQRLTPCLRCLTTASSRLSAAWSLEAGGSPFGFGCARRSRSYPCLRVILVLYFLSDRRNVVYWLEWTRKTGEGKSKRAALLEKSSSLRLNAARTGSSRPQSGRHARFREERTYSGKLVTGQVRTIPGAKTRAWGETRTTSTHAGQALYGACALFCV